MKNVVIYGCRECGQKLLKEFTLPSKMMEYNVLCFSDSNPETWGSEVAGKTVISPRELRNVDYDEIIVASLSGITEIPQMLRAELGIPSEKIKLEHAVYFLKAREVFLLYFSEMVYAKQIAGSVAEVGVWKGDFARFINAYFPDRKCYLFDTFEGHSEKDFQEEAALGIIGLFSVNNRNRFADTSVELVQAALPHPENACFRVGYFPDTAAGIDDTFVFVNIDANLYGPTKAALAFFWPRMVTGGVILCHDYFSWVAEPGAHIAIDEFLSERGLSAIPIGDRMSVALVKN